ncbi:hypothetical protein Cgig2_011107 [Carnegiea gigantea]|uniref:KHA domain-containing protein n=1 Tax=Carnegiea gigantea TaxID=171969 RepID=A0A9Q1JUF5_9CARY|nr:hypothetical protein Cgig2_011107 [Carnegiea gigantea]
MQANVRDGTIIINNLLEHMNSEENEMPEDNQEGNIPLWGTMQGNHEAVVKRLREHGAYISASDGCQYACISAEKNNLNLLTRIVRYGDNGISKDRLIWRQCHTPVTLPAPTNFNGATAFHVAVSEGNIEIVKYLLDQGSDIGKLDMQGSTPMSLVKQQGHQDITTLFQTTQLYLLSAQSGKWNDVAEHPMASWVIMSWCDGKGGLVRKLVALPKSFEEFLQAAIKKLGFLPYRVQDESGAEID